MFAVKSEDKDFSHNLFDRLLIVCIVDRYFLSIYSNSLIRRYIFDIETSGCIICWFVDKFYTFLSYRTKNVLEHFTKV